MSNEKETRYEASSKRHNRPPPSTHQTDWMLVMYFVFRGKVVFV